MIPGLHQGEGTPLGELCAAPAAALLALGHAPRTRARDFRIPGRLEVLGKHTDYGGGRSLLAAVERGFTMVCVPRADGIVRLSALDLGESAHFAVDAELMPARGWANYPMTVARRLARDFPGFGTGADIAVQGDLPLASGMSSSSAFVVGTFLCLASAGHLFDDPRFAAQVRNPDELAAYLAAVESGQGYGGLPGDTGVGTHGGSEDHTAILNARAGTLLQYRFVPAVRERSIELPAGHRFVIASSGVAAEKTGAARDRYNRASALARALRELCGGDAPSLAAALRASPDAHARLRERVLTGPECAFPRQELVARLDQFVEESERIIPAAGDALAVGDLTRFGALVDESQRYAEELLGTQIPETIELARSARCMGAAAASAFGAGYGGSVWALVAEADAPAFVERWRQGYAHAFPGRAVAAEFFVTGAAEGARREG